MGDAENRGEQEAQVVEDRQQAGAQHPAEGAAEDEAADAVSADLDRLLDDTKRERDSYLDLAQRARADFENFRRRATADVVVAERRGRGAIAKDLIPALDNLERALRSAGIDPEGGDSEPGEPRSEEVSARDALAHGVALVYRELAGALARSGVEAFDPEGEAFDPAQHEAVATRSDEGTAEGAVVETVDKGYRLDGQVLRAARVVVAE